jgi:hypothetical protein
MSQSVKRNIRLLTNVANFPAPLYPNAARVAALKTVK